MFVKLSHTLIAIIGLISHANSQALDLSEVYLKSLSYGGTGCPQGSFVKIQNANANLTALVFQPFTVQDGPGIADTEGRKNCQVNIEIFYPANLQFGTSSTTYSGVASLDKGVSGALKSLYYFSGNSAQVSTAYNLNGPYHDEYNVTVDVEASGQSILWSPCGTQLPLNINHQIVLSSTNATGYGYIKSDGNFASTMVWRKCT